MLSFLQAPSTLHFSHCSLFIHLVSRLVSQTKLNLLLKTQTSMSCVPPRSCLTTSILFPILRQWSAEHHEIGTAARLLNSCKWAYDLFKPIVNRGRVVLTASNVDEVVWVTRELKPEPHSFFQIAVDKPHY